MKPVLFEIGPLHIYGYGLMIALGILGAFWIACRLAQRHGMSSDHMFNAGIVGIVGGLAGAKVMYWIVELPSIIQNPALLLNLGEGFVVYGGLITGVLCPLVYARKHQINLLPYLDCAAPGIAFAQGCGRIGCFLAGCCYGAPTEAWYGVVFPENSLAPAGVKLIPTQLISAAGDLLIALVLVLLLLHMYGSGKQSEKSQKKHQTKPGMILAGYTVLYSIGRFAVEFLRSDDRGMVGKLSTSQFIALFTLAAGLILLVRCRKQREG